MILKFHVKLCKHAENSCTAGAIETEVRLTRFNNVHIICLKQFHKNLLTTKSIELRSVFINGKALRPLID